MLLDPSLRLPAPPPTPTPSSVGQAIFMTEFTAISTAPPRFAIKLRQPGTGDDGSGGADGEGPPSRLFSLRFTLTRVRGGARFHA